MTDNRIELIQSQLRGISRGLAFALLKTGRRRKIESTKPSLETAVSATINEIERLQDAIGVLFPQEEPKPPPGPGRVTGQPRRNDAA